jgi:hypothetical protein
LIPPCSLLAAAECLLTPFFQVKYCSENNKRLIHFSTCEVYGKTIGSFLSKDHLLRKVTKLPLRVIAPCIMSFFLLGGEGCMIHH